MTAIETLVTLVVILAFIGGTWLFMEKMSEDTD